MNPADWTPSGILVSGVIASDARAIGDTLQALGLQKLTNTEALEDLGRRVLANEGGTWESPPHIAASELALLGASRSDEAARLLATLPEIDEMSKDQLWVWADPRHSLLTPFWSTALCLDLALVHVHRDPRSSVAAISEEQGIPPGAALALWERYNRAALVSCAQRPSVIVGVSTMVQDPKACVQELAAFLDRLDGQSGQRDIGSASRAITEVPGERLSTSSDVVLSTQQETFNKILDGLEIQSGSGVEDGQAAEAAFGQLPDLYDADYYHAHLGGIPYNRSEPHWMRFFGIVADHIIADLAPHSVLDAGCAIGLLVECLRDRGVDARGFDISEWAIEQVPETIRPFCTVGSLLEPIRGQFDLITCIEVLEHLPASQAAPVIANLCAHADAVLFSSDPADFDEPTHLNVETTGYWAKHFAQQGFYRDFDHDVSYLAPHAMLFRRSRRDTADLVSEYERVLWNTRKTLAQVHETLSTGWKTTAERVEALEQRFDAQYAGVADERTVTALESLLAGTDALRLSVSGPPVVGIPIDSNATAAEDYRLWRDSRVPPDPPADGPCFSVIVPVFNPEAEHLTACIRSVRAQTYGNWELILVDVSTVPHVRPICERFTALDSRVHIVRCDNSGIAENTDAGVRASTGDWIVFFDHDDTLESHALAALARHIEENSTTDFVYSDEDKIDPAGQYVAPFFKPDWSPDLLRTVNYICHLVGVRRTIYDDVGGLRTGYEGAQDYDFVLRATAASRSIGHVADVLYHWRQHAGSTASDVRVKPEAHSAGRRALESFARRHLPGAWVEPGADLTTHRVRYPLRYEKVSIVIPFRDEPELTDACLRSIAASQPVSPLEVLLVSNQSSDAMTFSYMEDWDQRYAWARVLNFDEPFNFQILNNWAARQAEGALLLFLNNDVEALHTGWLETLAEHAQRPDVGAVGARLFYPDGLVQHAGVSVGIGGLADHPWSGLHPEAWTPTGPSYWTRDFLAVTAACLMVDHEKFDQINGFDERFTVCGGDVDLCLRLFENHLWNVMTPFARLLHRESATRQKNPPEGDIQQSLRAYRKYLSDGDPFFNPNLSRSDRSCRVSRSVVPKAKGTRS